MQYVLSSSVFLNSSVFPLSISLAFSLRRPVEEADATCNDLMGAFAAVVFTPDFTVKKILSERFVAVLPMYVEWSVLVSSISFSLRCRLVQPYGFNFLTKLVLHIVKELSLPREVDCDRLDFYSIAETMAFLVKLNLINVEGTIDWASTWLTSKSKNQSCSRPSSTCCPRNRCALPASLHSARSSSSTWTPSQASAPNPSGWNSSKHSNMYAKYHP